VAASPMEQFLIKPIVPIHIGGWDISFTNSSLWMCVVVATVSLFMTLSVRSNSLVPTRMQSLSEMAYLFVNDMVHSVGGVEGMRFFPFIFTLFMFVLFSNVLGIIPFSFTVTSHIIVTFAMAAVIFLIVLAVGFSRHGVRFFSLFVPDVPWYMLPLLIPIETISFVIRPLTLSVRLFANMLAGHTMLQIFAGFVIGLAGAGGIFAALAPLPVLLIVAIVGLELLVAFLQAYVFTILTCIYLNEAVRLHDDHH
jgi:F-type H+-transporting ATPase subunit a